MLGAIVGDIVGSRFEFHNLKSREFEFMTDECFFTDDSVMTLAIAEALLECHGRCEHLEETTIVSMQRLGRMYPNAGYGGRFSRWLTSTSPRPYNSFGNGAGMRVSPVAYVGQSIEDVIDLSTIVTRVTHNHVEGMKGAEAIAVATYLARTGHTKNEIRDYIEEHYYALDFTLDEIRDDYVFHVDSMRSVPESIVAFLEGEDFESTIRGAISIGGDSDTIGAMAGAIAGAYYGIPEAISTRTRTYLDGYLMDILDRFESTFL